MTEQGRGPGIAPDDAEPADSGDQWPDAEQGDPTGDVTGQGRGPGIAPDDAEPADSENHTA